MPSLIAHRGYPRRYPENTLAGIEAAIATGARYVEVDVQLSADGVPVVFHDGKLRRLCGVPGHITKVSMADIRGLRVDGELVPTLAEFVELLRRHRDVHAFVELKQETIDVVGEAVLLAAVADVLAPVRAQCMLISFNATVLEQAVGRGWTVGWVTAARPSGFPEGLEQGMGIWFCDVTVLPPDGPLNDSKVPLAVYEVADPETARRLAARGAAFIETFDIGGMRRALAGWT